MEQNISLLNYVATQFRIARAEGVLRGYGDGIADAKEVLLFVIPFIKNWLEDKTMSHRESDWNNLYK